MLIAVCLSILLPVGTAKADDEFRLPVPEPGVVESISARRCTQDNVYDTDAGPTYDAILGKQACKRLRIVFGPITVKPGQNDVLIQPVTFEKPLYDGMLIRFKPSLVDQSGYSPPVERIHLHHGTWLNTPGLTRQYGSGPWIASGEEKTIAPWPKGYGLEIRQSDSWLFLHMVHSAVPQPMVVWATYDLDFIGKADAATLGLKNTRGMWLDVGNGGWHPDSDPYLLNPIYNSQKGFGNTTAPNPVTGLPQRACAWPKENCANFNSANRRSANQGNPVSVGGKTYVIGDGELGNGVNQGEIVMMGGHLHTGGLNDTIELGRDLDGSGKVEESEFRTIHISDAYYWNWTDSSKVGAPPSSWDFSMTGVTKDIGWSVNVNRGDVLRLNAVYDSELGSWYENMGIVMTWIAPGEQSGFDAFAPGAAFHKGLPGLAPYLPEGVLPGAENGMCYPSQTVLCVRGTVSHGHYKAASNHAPTIERPLPAVKGPVVDQIQIAGFLNGVADMNLVMAGAGIPQLIKNKPVTFWNADAGSYIWHTITRCRAPCNSGVTTNYPIADGADFDRDPMDFDSAEIGVGLAPSGTSWLQKSVTAGQPTLEQTAFWKFTPTRNGVYTFFCRIHPFMRGVFEVVDT